MRRRGDHTDVSVQGFIESILIMLRFAQSYLAVARLRSHPLPRALVLAVTFLFCSAEHTV